MNSKFCKKKSIVQFTCFSFVFITKLYSIFYYLLYFLLFSKFTYYFVWRNLPTNSNYFTKIYLLFSVSLVMTNEIAIQVEDRKWEREIVNSENGSIQLYRHRDSGHVTPEQYYWLDQILRMLGKYLDVWGIKQPLLQMYFSTFACIR